MTNASHYQPESGLALIEQFGADARARRRYLGDRLERISALDPQIKAMTAVLGLDAAISRSDAVRGPLHGLPVLVKDIFDTRDLPTAYGSPIYAGHQPASDAALVTLLQRRGAAVLGKTVTCEFAYMAPTETRNPSDLGRTAGGSSSGSAAAVAAGYAPFAVGSQTGGSTIRPASFCGIAGYKPSFDRLPTAGMKCFSWSFDTVGLFAARVADLAFLAVSLTGERVALDPSRAALTFGVPDAYPWTPPSDNAVAVLDMAARAIERAGGRIRRLRFDPWMAELIDAHATIQSYEASQTLGYEYDYHRARLSPMLRNFLDRAAEVSFEQYREALGRAQLAQRTLLPTLFKDIDVLLTPSAPDEALQGFESTGDPAFNRNWTLLGTPCVGVPGLRGNRHGHIGVQVIGLPGDDARALTAAAFVEHAIRKQA